MVYFSDGEICVTKVDESVANVDICGRFCGSCPTYRENALKSNSPSLLFCARGKSGKTEPVKRITCNCPGCGVHKRYKLTGDFYCSK
jgi:hypothetical protein